MSLTEKAVAFLTLTRPLEWSKSFGNMIIGALLATQGLGFSWETFLIAFIAVGPFLWGGLYTLNDWTDSEKDKLHKVKKLRPIPSGKISPTLALAFSMSLIVFSILIGYLFVNPLQGSNSLFMICLGAMLVNQVAYTMSPFNFKKFFPFDLISGSLINPFFRFFAGWTLFQANFEAPLLILVFILGFQFGGFALYRQSGKKLEKELGFKSSFVVLGENKLRIIAYLAMFLAAVAYVYACLSGILPFKMLWLAAASLLLLPFYGKGILKPEKMDMKFMYRLLYVHYSLFVIGFILLYLYV